MAYDKELIDMAILKTVGHIAAGDSFADAFQSGSKTIKNIQNQRAESYEQNLDLQKKELEVMKLRDEVVPFAQGPIEQAYTPRQQEQDNNVHLAYGPIDAATFGIGTIGEAFLGMSPTESRQAREVARNLNTQIKIVLTGSFKGRPSNYLMTEIQALLPQVGKWYAGDAHAEARYRELKGLFEAWLPELEQEVQLATGKTKVELVQQRAKVAQINKRLETVINGFNGGSNAPNPLEIPDVPTGLQLPDDEEGKQALRDLFMQEIPGREYNK